MGLVPLIWKNLKASEKFTPEILFLQDILHIRYFSNTHLSLFYENFSAFGTAFDDTATLHQQHERSDILAFLVYYILKNPLIIPCSQLTSEAL